MNLGGQCYSFSLPKPVSRASDEKRTLFVNDGRNAYAYALPGFLKGSSRESWPPFVNTLRARTLELVLDVSE